MSSDRRRAWLTLVALLAAVAAAWLVAAADGLAIYDVHVHTDYASHVPLFNPVRNGRPEPDFAGPSGEGYWAPDGTAWRVFLPEPMAALGGAWRVKVLYTTRATAAGVSGISVVLNGRVYREGLRANRSVKFTIPATDLRPDANLLELRSPAADTFRGLRIHNHFGARTGFPRLALIGDTGLRVRWASGLAPGLLGAAVLSLGILFWAGPGHGASGGRRAGWTPTRWRRWAGAFAAVAAALAVWNLAAPVKVVVDSWSALVLVWGYFGLLQVWFVRRPAVAGVRQAFACYGDVLIFFIAVLAKVLLSHSFLDLAEANSPRVILMTGLGLVALAAAAALFTPRLRAGLLLGVNLLLSLLLCSDVVYCRVFHDFITLAVTQHVTTLGPVTDHVLALLTWPDGLFFLDLPVWGLVMGLHARRWTPRRPRRRVVLPIVLIAGAASCIDAIWQGHTVPAWNNWELAPRVGILHFHLFDVYQHIRSRLVQVSVSEEALAETYAWFQSRQVGGPAWVPFGVARGKNVILVQLESFEAFPVGLTFMGQEITPCINRMLSECIYFEKFFNQTSAGRSSDADFIVLNSLLPAARGAIPFQFSANTFWALPAILAENGYTTYSTEACASYFWRVGIMHRAYGFAQSCYVDCFQIDETTGGFGLTDRSFFRQVVPRLAELGRPFLAFLATQTGHGPFYIPEAWRELRFGDLEGSLIADFLHACHFVDAALDQFVSRLKAVGLADETVLVIYGDHDAGIPEDQWSRLPPALYQPPPWGWPTKLPLLVRLPGGRFAGRRSECAGQIDLAPSLLHLLGIPRQGTFFIGRNLFLEGGRPVIAFRNGSAADQKHFGHPPRPNRPNYCFELDTRRRVPFERMRESFEEAQEQLKMSDRVLEANLIPRLRRLAAAQTAPAATRRSGGPVSAEQKP